MASETNPSITSAKALRQDKKFTEEFITQIQHDVNADAQAMDQWVERKRKAYDRRYQQGGRGGVNFPWPGASDFDYPGSDIEVDNAKPGLMNIVFGGRRIVDAMPISPDAAAQAVNAGITMEYLLRYRMGERGVPDYFRQTALAAESFIQHGTCVDKVIYSYLTERRRESYTSQTLPEALAQIQVVDAIGEQQQQALMQQGILAIPRDQFGEFAKQIEQVIVGAFNLDLQNREDRIVVNQVLSFIKANNPDATLDFVATQVIEDCPRIINCEIENVIVPSGSKTLQSASRLAHDMWFNEADLQRRAFSGQWAPDAVEDVLANSRGNRRTGQIDGNRLHDAMRRRSDTNYEVDRDDAQFKISEVYCYKLNAQKVPVPIVITMERQMGTVLRAVEFDYAHGAWPFTESSYEVNDHGYFASRGIPEKIEGLEKHMTGMMRAEFNGLIMATSQSFTYRMSSGINPQKLRWMPHLMIPVRSHDDLQPIQTHTNVLALERPQMMLQNLISKVTGGRLNTTTNEMRQDRPPTAAQVNETSGASQNSNGLRGMYFQMGRNGLYRQVWALWRQFGPDEFYAMVANEPLQKLSQHQIRGEFQIIPVGAIGDMDPEFRTGQSFQILDLLMKAEPIIQKDPRYAPDVTQAVKDVLDRMDVTASMRLLKRRTPDEMKKFIKQQQAEAQRLQELRSEAERLQVGAASTPEGAANVLREVRSNTPHKGLQPIIEGGQQAAADAANAAALVNGEQQ
jgi:hypothetical protein